MSVAEVPEDEHEDEDEAVEVEVFWTAPQWIPVHTVMHTLRDGK